LRRRRSCFAALTVLSAQGVHVTDVAQITIKGALVLCAEVSSEKSLSLADVESALSTRDIVRDRCQRDGRESGAQRSK